MLNVNPLSLPFELLDMTTMKTTTTMTTTTTIDAAGARGILIQPSVQPSRRPATAPPTAPGHGTAPSSSSHSSNNNNDNPNVIDNSNNNNNNNNNRRTSHTGATSTALRATVQFDNSVVDRADRPRPSKSSTLLHYPACM